MDVLPRGDGTSGAADGKAVFQHFLALGNGTDSHLVPKGDCVVQSQRSAIWQRYLLTGLKVVKRYCYIVGGMK